MTDESASPVESRDGHAAYDVPFVDDSSHGHVVALLRQHAEPGLIVDVGCGYAPHAEVLRDAGFSYAGVDADVASVESLSGRGFTAVQADADDVDALRSALDELVAAGPEAGEAGTPSVSAVLVLDVLEHLVAPHHTLDAISGWMRNRDVAILGISLPNVSHQDVALKLLAGRFDLTPTGLLDHTHLRFFTDRSLGALTAGAGLREIARHDVRSPKSDQDWPEQHPALSDGALLGSYLRAMRSRSDDHGTTFQFVRLFAPSEQPTDRTAPPTLLAARPESPERAITVLVRAGCSDADLLTLQQDVDAQASGLATMRTLDGVDDIEHLLANITTAYVTIVDGGDRLAPGWATSVLSTSDRYPAAVVRSGPAVPGESDGVGGVGIDVDWAARFSPFDHYVEDATPGAAVAFPASFLRDVRTTPMSDPSDVDTHALLLEASTLCGVVDSGSGTVAVRDGWAMPVERVDATVERLARGALLAPVGAAREIARLRRADAELTALRSELDRLHADVALLNADLARRPVRAVRRGADLVNRLLRRS